MNPTCAYVDCTGTPLANGTTCINHCTAAEWIAEQDRTISERTDRTGVIPVGRTPYPRTQAPRLKRPFPDRTPPMNRTDIYKLIDAERDRQETKWGHPHNWGEGSCSSANVATMTKVAVLAEEFGEIARAALELDHDGLADELVQTAAVCIAWLEGL